MSAVSTKPILTFAGYCLDAQKRLLRAPDGAPVNLSSRAFETLLYLASHPHELVSKRRLMQAVWPNSAVEDNNLNQQISTLRKVLGETAGEHRFIITVTGRGYRFVQDVQRLESLPLVADGPRPSPQVGEDAGGPPRGAVPNAGRRAGRKWLRPPALAAAVVVVLLLGGAYALMAQRPSTRTEAEGPSIAVLPFADLSPEHDQTDFADGLSEELLTALGQLNGLRVIGRTSSFSFKGKNEDVRRVASTLGVRHMLEGSVRRDGDRLRVTAELVDGTNGSQQWVQTYDRTLGDVFAIQKDIAESVAATLRLALRPERVAATVGGTRNVEAYEAYIAARAVTNNGGSTRARDAIGLLERAVRLDPNFALAWAALAQAYTSAVDFPLSSALSLTPAELEQRISKAALRAFELAPDAPATLLAAGTVSMRNRDWAEAERRLSRAVELAGPYDYDANFLYALFLMDVGRATEAIPYEQRAMRAEPLLMRPVAFLAALDEMRGDLDKAEALLRASKDRMGQQTMRRQGLTMIHLARHDVSWLRSSLTENGQPCDWLDDPARGLTDLRARYVAAERSGSSGQLMPVALFASLLGDQRLSLDALRAMGPTPNLITLWRPALSEVRRQPGFETLVRDLGLVDYWRASGDWGDFCRDNGSGSFVCG